MQEFWHQVTERVAIDFLFSPHVLPQNIAKEAFGLTKYMTEVH